MFLCSQGKRQGLYFYSLVMGEWNCVGFFSFKLTFFIGNKAHFVFNFN